MTEKRRYSPRAFSRHHGCRISDAFTYCGKRLVILENDLLRVCVLPEKGAEIFALEYKPRGVDVLYKPYQSPQDGGKGQPVNSFTSGWQEIFPSGGAACQVKDVEIGPHGEVLTASWDWCVLKDHEKEVSIRFSVETKLFPYKLERTLSLRKGKAVLFVDETLTNMGDVRLPFMWGHHPSFSAPFLDGSCLLDLPSGTLHVHEGEQQPQQRLTAGSTGNWPLGMSCKGGKLNLREVPPPTTRSADMFYLTDFKEGWYALSNRKLGFGLAMQWDADLFSSLWVWQEFCGTKAEPWKGETYVMALEPFTSFTTSGGAGLAEVMRSGRERWLYPDERLSTSLKAVFYEFPDCRGIRKVMPDGEVIFRY